MFDSGQLLGYTKGVNTTVLLQRPLHVCIVELNNISVPNLLL